MQLNQIDLCFYTWHPILSDMVEPEFETQILCINYELIDLLPSLFSIKFLHNNVSMSLYLSQIMYPFENSIKIFLTDQFSDWL